MRRTATPALVAAVVVILGTLFSDNSRAALFAAKQAAVAPGAGPNLHARNSSSKSGTHPRATPIRTIRRWHPMARSGTPARCPIPWVA